MAKRRRFCRGCGNRIHRASYRCPFCRRVSPPARFYVALAALVVLALLALKYLKAI
jgi:hypothetical protein